MLDHDTASGSGIAASPNATADLPPALTGPTGNVSGTVVLSGKAPAPVLIDTSMDPACGLSGKPIYSEQYDVHSGKLGNVYVYVKSGPALGRNYAAMQLPPVVLDQKGCQYVPHVVAVMQGRTVEFLNSDPTMHNVHTMPTVIGNETVDISMGPRGTPVTRSFDKPEQMMPVRCNNHPWMQAFINISPTPWFAITDASGHFDLHGLPAGQYTLGFVQEKLGEKTADVAVLADGTAKADASFSLGGK
jgi:plastocyanin